MSSTELNKLRDLNKSTAIQVQHVLGDETQQMISKEQIKKEQNSDDHVHGSNCKHGSNDKKSKNKGKARKNFGIIGYTLFTCLSCGYLEVECLLPFHPDPFKRQFLPVLSILVCGLAIWSYLRTVTTTNQVPKLKGAPLIQDSIHLDNNYLSRQCQTCKYYKMPRVSHCSSCGTCILKLDHHCMWTQNCIGYRNQKSFYMFTFWMTIGLLQFWTATITVASQLMGSCKFFSYFEPGVYVLWAITCFSALFVGMMIVALWISHTLMIFTNFTTLTGMKTKKVCPFPFFQFRDMILEDDNINTYDRGQIQNIRTLFETKNIILSLLPLQRQIKHDFEFQAPNPKPTNLQLAKFIGDLQIDKLRESQLSTQLPKLKQLYKGKKFIIKQKIIEM